MANQACERCGLCCKMVGFRVEGMSRKELQFLTTRGIFVYPMEDGFMVVFHQECPMLDGNDCRLHDGGKPEVCRKGDCLKGVPWFDAAARHYRLEEGGI